MATGNKPDITSAAYAMEKERVSDRADKLVSNRKGGKGECQQEVYDALSPIIEKFKGRWTKDEYAGFLDGTFRNVVRRIVYDC